MYLTHKPARGSARKLLELHRISFLGGYGSLHIQKKKKIGAVSIANVKKISAPYDALREKPSGANIAEADRLMNRLTMSAAYGSWAGYVVDLLPRWKLRRLREGGTVPH